jgi:hypothetical protein
MKVNANDLGFYISDLIQYRIKLALAEYHDAGSGKISIYENEVLDRENNLVRALESLFDKIEFGDD